MCGCKPGKNGLLEVGRGKAQFINSRVIVGYKVALDGVG